MILSFIALHFLTCAVAAGSAKTTAGSDSFSNEESIHREALSVTKYFINSLPALPEGGDKWQDSSEGPFGRLQHIAFSAYEAEMFFSSGSVEQQKLMKVKDSLLGTYVDAKCNNVLKAKKITGDKDEAFICIQAVNEMIETFQSATLAELSFEKLLEFSNYLIRFSTYMYSNGECEVYLKKMNKLALRKVEQERKTDTEKNDEGVCYPLLQRMYAVCKNARSVAGSTFGKLRSAVHSLHISGRQSLEVSESKEEHTHAMIKEPNLSEDKLADENPPEPVI